MKPHANSEPAGGKRLPGAPQISPLPAKPTGQELYDFFYPKPAPESVGRGTDNDRSDR